MCFSWPFTVQSMGSSGNSFCISWSMARRLAENASGRCWESTSVTATPGRWWITVFILLSLQLVFRHFDVGTLAGLRTNTAIRVIAIRDRIRAYRAKTVAGFIHHALLLFPKWAWGWCGIPVGFHIQHVDVGGYALIVHVQPAGNPAGLGLLPKPVNLVGSEWSFRRCAVVELDGCHGSFTSRRYLKRK